MEISSLVCEKDGNYNILLTFQHRVASHNSTRNTQEMKYLKRKPQGNFN